MESASKQHPGAGINQSSELFNLSSSKKLDNTDFKTGANATVASFSCIIFAGWVISLWIMVQCKRLRHQTRILTCSYILSEVWFHFTGIVLSAVTLYFLEDSYIGLILQWVRQMLVLTGRNLITWSITAVMLECVVSIKFPSPSIEFWTYRRAVYAALLVWTVAYILPWVIIVIDFGITCKWMFGCSDVVFSHTRLILSIIFIVSNCVNVPAYVYKAGVIRKHKRHVRRIRNLYVKTRARTLQTIELNNVHPARLSLSDGAFLRSTTLTEQARKDDSMCTTANAEEPTLTTKPMRIKINASGSTMAEKEISIPEFNKSTIDETVHPAILNNPITEGSSSTATLQTQMHVTTDKCQTDPLSAQCAQNTNISDEQTSRISSLRGPSCSTDVMSVGPALNQAMQAEGSISISDKRKESTAMGTFMLRSKSLLMPMGALIAIIGTTQTLMSVLLIVFTFETVFINDNIKQAIDAIFYLLIFVSSALAQCVFVFRYDEGKMIFMRKFLHWSPKYQRRYRELEKNIQKL